MGRLKECALAPIDDGETVAGAETLVRWEHSDKGTIAPAQFIPVAEQAGLIELLGSWILREAVRQAAEWHRDGVGGGRLWISVNLSVEQLANPALVGEVELALRDHGLPPELLVLELTESAVMRDVVTTTQRLDALKALGVRIDVDDFGEGHSSLAYLASLPLDLIKIPKTFVDRLGEPDANVALVRAIVELARSFGLRTVVEGIEGARPDGAAPAPRVRPRAGLPVRPPRGCRRGGPARGRGPPARAPRA